MSIMSLLTLATFLLLQTIVVAAASSGASMNAFGVNDILPHEDAASLQNRNALEDHPVAPRSYCGFKNDEHPWRVDTAGFFNVCALAALNAQNCEEAHYIDYGSRCFWNNNSCNSPTQYGGSQCYHDNIENQQECEERPTFQGVDVCSWKEPEEETSIEFSSYCGFPNSVNPWSLPLNVCAVDAYTGNYKEQCETSSSLEFLTCAWNNGSCHGDATTCHSVSNQETCQTTSYLQFGLCKWYVPPTTSPTAAPSVSVSPTISVVPSTSLPPSMSVPPSVTFMPSASTVPSTSEIPSASMMPSLSSAPSLTLTPSGVGSKSPSASLAPSSAPSLASSASPSSLPTSHAEVLQVTTPVPLTASPTPAPTRDPTAAPTPAPTPGPTRVPSWAPSHSPTNMPSLSPSDLPSVTPTVVPSAISTLSPSLSPSMSPTDTPTDMPTSHPTRTPSATPSSSPTVSPSDSPTFEPSGSSERFNPIKPRRDDNYDYNTGGLSGLTAILVVSGLLAAMAAVCACIWKSCWRCFCRKKADRVFVNVDEINVRALADKQLLAAEMGQQQS